MLKKKIFIGSLMVGLISLMATPAFARSISLKDGGIALWIFLIIGGIIVLLQLIPAGILFFSLIGTSTGVLFGRKKALKGLPDEKEIMIPGYEPATVKK